jgi:methylase of polypeptide subunit release factors
MTDVNPTALEYAEANCLRAGVQPVQFIGTRDLDGLEGPFDLIVANPPFIADGGGPTYRDGGDMHGAALSLRWAQAAAARLSVGGRALVYTGSAIVRGEDRLRAALRTAFDSGDLQLDYAEIDPDIFGEQLSAPAYADVERIAAVGFCITRRAAQQS